MQVERVRRAICIVRRKDPLPCLGVEALHLCLVPVSFLTQLLRSRTLATRIRLFRRVKGMRHFAALGLRPTAQLFIMGILCIFVIIVKLVYVRASEDFLGILGWATRRILARRWIRGLAPRGRGAHRHWAPVP